MSVRRQQPHQMRWPARLVAVAVGATGLTAGVALAVADGRTLDSGTPAEVTGVTGATAVAAGPTASDAIASPTP